jgi:23S rRNA pseudouridine1911/1915/1917 synthase
VTENNTEAAVVSTVVSEEWAGQRIDVALARMTGMPRTRVAAQLKDGRAGIVGLDSTEPSRKLRGGELVFYERELLEKRPEPAFVDFPVLYEDQHIAVVSKPPGISVHPGAGSEEITLVSGVLQRWPEVAEVGDPMRPGIVHRLDKDTSGLMMIALTQQAYEGLIAAFKERRVRRTYTAVVWGILEADVGRIEGPIGRLPSDPTRFGVVLAGKPAASVYYRLATWEKASLAKLDLETGRTHQIRVHLSSIGHPVVGDRVYGTGASSELAERLGLDRPFLHALEIRFDHPITGEPVELSDRLPADLDAALSRLGVPSFGSVESVLGADAGTEDLR